MNTKTQAVFFGLLLLGVGSAIAAPAPISGSDVRGGESTAIDFAQAKKGTVIAFLSAKCPCSASHEPALKSLYAEFAPKGFAFYGVHSNTDEDETSTRTHFAAASLPFPVLTDLDARIADAYGALKTPHVFIVNPKGEIVFQGGVDDSHVASEAKKFYLKEALLTVERGERPSKEQVRTLGCVIKRR